ncbi:MAG: oligosaccharide flippase family protein [Clostridiaceae bacterium]
MNIIKNKKFDYLFISGATVFSTMMSFIYNIYMRKYIEPYDFGLFTTASLLLLYLSFLQLGVLNAFNRDYPQLLGGNDLVNANRQKNIVFTYLFVIYGIVCVFLIAFFILIYITNKLEPKLFWGFLINCILVFFNMLYSLLDAIFRSEGRFKYVSFLNILKSLILILIGLTFVNKFGYYAMLAALFISSISIVVLNFKSFLQFKIQFDKKIILTMILSGAPLLINGLAWTVIMSIDRFVILTFLSMEQLGIYSTALLGFSTLVLIPQSISQVFYVKMSRSYGEKKSIEELLRASGVYTKILSILTSLISVCTFLILPIFIEYVMPKYSQGIESAQILVIGVAFYCTSMLFSNVLSILKLNYYLIKSSIVLCILNASLSTFFILTLGKDIQSVAYGTSISYMLYSFSIMLILREKVKYKVRDFFIHAWIPVIITLFPCILLNMLIKNEILKLFTIILLTGLVAIAVNYKDIKKFLL